jgi:cell division control protein 6
VNKLDINHGDVLRDKDHFAAIPEDSTKNAIATKSSSLLANQHSPRTPSRTNKTPSFRTPSSVLQDLKTSFRRCSTPSKLVGRDLERNAIHDFITTHCNKRIGSSLYISGVPGTGKSALLTEIISKLKLSYFVVLF